MKINRRNRLEEKINKRQMRIEAFEGRGLYVFENTTKGDLQLPKALPSGKTWIKPGEQFQGDSYYNSLMGIGLRQIRCIIDPNTERNTEMTENKLILDQPDQVTEQGTIEHVIAPQRQIPLTEGQPKKEPADVLITEDPMAGVEIILN